MGKGLQIIEILRCCIMGDAFKEKYRMSEKNFTRERKLTFATVIHFMCTIPRRSLAIEIDSFLKNTFGNLVLNVKEFTVSAFNQRRKQIKPEAFSFLNKVLVEAFYNETDEPVARLNGFRLLAVDGTSITLPDTDELKNIYGVARNQTNIEIVQGRASVLYDVMNCISLDAILENQKIGEHELALRHKDHWTPTDLIIYDRGYFNFGFVYQHVMESKAKFLIRAIILEKGQIRDFVDSGAESAIIDFRPSQFRSCKGKKYSKNSTVKVRLVRVELENGVVEVLITTLLDEVQFPTYCFNELYYRRWGIEVYFDELKNKLKMEFFSGYSNSIIQQDFHCAIFISNIQSVIVNDVKEELRIQNESTKLNYKVNTNLSYGFLKLRVVALLHMDCTIENVYEELKQLFLENKVAVKPGRNNPREKEKYRCREKPKVTKNQRDAF